MIERQRKTWQPDWRLWVFCLSLLPVLIGLGVWQINRAADKQRLLERWQQAPEQYAWGAQAATNIQPGQPVMVEGQYSDTTWLLDNRTRNGAVGYEVLTLFEPISGAALVVNRGWVQAPSRRTLLPVLPQPAGLVSITGRLSEYPEPPQLAKTPDSSDWPRRVQALTQAKVEAESPDVAALVLRLEDIDPQRSRPEYATALVEDLHWLGLDWDYGPDVGGPCGPYVQSQRGSIYDGVLAQLEKAGATYPCFCTRKELRQLAEAPHVDDAGAPYPGTCRNLGQERIEALIRSGRRASIRLRCPEAPISFTDLLLGPQTIFLTDCGGDFALRRSDGVVAYQLAVAVDDALMGVTQVVRGRDILSSTPRQIALLQLLGYGAPSYAHVPLLLDEEGERLAKRHNSLSLRYLREQGVDPRRIVGLLGMLAGLDAAGRAVSPAELLPAFDWGRLPRQDVRLRNSHLRGLL